MRTGSLTSSVLLATLLGCSHGAPQRPLSSPARAPETAALDGPSEACAAAPTLDALLARHADAFGDAASLRAALPRRLRGTSEIAGSKSTFSSLLTPDAYRVDASLAGLPIANGIDAQGPWSLGPDGVVHRLRGDEAMSVRFEHWLATRGYLSSLDAQRDAVRCEATPEGAQLIVSARLPELGSPELRFDLGSARLLSVGHASVDGERSTVTFGGFAAAEQGVRWPLAWSEQGENLVSFAVTEAASAACEAGCTAPPADSFVMPWPRSGRITLPMVVYQDQLLLRAKLAGRDTWSMLDSGASVSALDATRGLGAAFEPAVSIVGSGSTQALEIGLGEIHDIGLAEVVMPRLPVASVPIPVLDDFGARRPEIVLGYSLFAAAAVRVDYQKGELVLAPHADTLHTARAIPAAMRYWGGMAMIEIEVDGVRGFAQLDTGSAGGLTLHKRWASAHALPPKGAQTVEMRYLGGAGTEETTATLWRAGKLSIGPIVVDAPRVNLSDPPGTGHVAGLLGNEVFARCRAVVFDMRERTLWFEPPCDRPVPENHAGWRLSHRPDVAHPDRPWVVSTVAPEGTAARAGLLPGDRLLAVGGKPATADLDGFTPQLARAPGSVVDIAFVRDGTPRTVKATLTRLLD